MTPTQIMLRNFALAAAAGGFLGYQVSNYGMGKRKHSSVPAVLLGATGIMMLYGITKERVLA